MATRQFEDILDECVSMLQAGASIDDCVAPYPEHADQLRGRLRAAQTLLSVRPVVEPDSSAQDRGRARLLLAVEEQRRAPPEPEPTLALAGPLRSMFEGVGSRLRLLPQALPAVVAMLVLGGAAWGVAAGTGNPNPGAWFASSASREDRVEFRGTIVTIDATSLTLATASGEVTVAITPQTEFEDENEQPLTLADFAPGDFVKVSALRAEDGSLLAREVEHEDDDDLDEDRRDRDDRDNSGPGNADDGQGDDDDQDNSGPGNADDDRDGDDDQDNSGPGNADDDRDGDDRDNSGPGNADDDDDDRDNSGPGNADDGDDDDDDDDGDD